MDENNIACGNLDFSVSYDSAMRAMQAVEESVAMANMGRELSEQKKQHSLDNIAENTRNTVNSLAEINQLLIENNRLLKEKNTKLTNQVAEIADILNQLIEVTREANENQEEAMEQALALAVQLNVTAECNGRTKIGDIISQASINSILLAIQIYLKNHGVF